MNYQLLLQIEMEETKRLREELSFLKLKLEVAENRIRRQSIKSTPTKNTYNINNSSNFLIKA